MPPFAKSPNTLSGDTNEPFIPFLAFPGTAEEVLEFYRTALGGDLEIIRFGGSPAEDHMDAGWADKVLYGKLTAPGGTICVMDAPPDRVGTVGGGNFLIQIHLSDRDEAAPVFEKLSAGGSVIMPLEKTFWSPMFGMLADKFGTKWMIDCAA